MRSVLRHAAMWAFRPLHRVADERGTVAVLFALAVAPLTFLVGAALDYSGAANLKAHLQKATDGTGLRLCQIPDNPKKKDLEDAAVKMMSSYFGSVPYTIEDLKLRSSPRSIEISTKALFETSIIKGLNSRFATIPVTADATCFGEPQTFEIALVLDTTGSMSNSAGAVSKIEALRTAATDFVNFVYASPSMSSGSRISLVPFAASVAVNSSAYRNATWIDQAGNSPIHWSIVRDSPATVRAAGVPNRFAALEYLRAVNPSWGWNGCFESLPYPLNTQDSYPTSSNPGSYYVPLWAPDESGAGGEDPLVGHRDASNNVISSMNSYLDDTNGYCAPTTDEATRTGQGCKYLQPTNPRDNNTRAVTGPNISCTSRPLTRLTSTKKTLTDEIAALQPLGSTNIHEGFMWGWRTLSPVGVFKTGTTDETPVAYTKQYNNKVIVLMTDGTNQWIVNPFTNSQPNPYNVLKSYHSAYGFLVNPDGTGPNSRLPGGNANPTNGNQTRAAIDALTREACRNARAAPNNIAIYTIGFNGTSDPIDQQGIDLLRDCAGSSVRAFVANDSTALLNVFRQIAQDIGNLRLMN